MAHDIQLLVARQMLEVWDASHLKEIIETIEQGLREESDIGIDGAKCLVEAVCKTILCERGKEIEMRESPGTLIRKVTQALDLEDDKGGECLQLMVRGMTSAAGGLEAMRDALGPFAHGRDAYHNKLGDWHRLMAVRTAETIAVLLFEAHCSFRTNIRCTRALFSETAPENHAIDRLSDVQVDTDTFEIVINEAYRFSPSQVRYELDREGYVNERTKASNLPEKDIE